MKVSCPSCRSVFTEESERGLTCPECRYKFNVNNVNDLMIIRDVAAASGRERFYDILLSSRNANLPDAFAIDLFNSNKSLDECQHNIVAELAKREDKFLNQNYCQNYF